MLLESPGTASVRNYLRTVDFESTEVKIHWTDEKGDWVRRIFASRPDNVIVQWLTAPDDKSLNVRITMSEGAGRPTTGGGQDFAGIRSRAGAQGASGGSDNTIATTIIKDTIEINAIFIGSFVVNHVLTHLSYLCLGCSFRHFAFRIQHSAFTT